MTERIEASSSDPLREQERKLIDRRREKATGVKGPVVGVAISGGGVRSATLGLGFLQALAEKKLLHRFDYLSTVSGGGYIGSFWGSLFVDPAARGSGSPGAAHDVTGVEDVLTRPGSEEIRWLRENGRYLSPNGAGDSLLAVAILLRNWIAVHVSLDLLVLAVFMVLAVARTALAQAATSSPFSIVPRALQNFPLPLAAVALIAWSVPAGWAYWMARSHDPRDRGSSATVLAFASLAASIVVAITRPGDASQPAAIAVAVALAVTFGLWIMAGGTSRDDEKVARSRLSLWLRNGLIATAIAAAIAVVDAAGFGLAHLSRQAVASFVGSAWGVLVAASVVAQRVLAWFGGDSKGSRVRLSLGMVAGVAGTVVAAAFLTAMSAVAYSVTANRGLPWCATAAAIVIIAAWFAGQGFAFLNDSSHAALYSGRLARAYLGASNPDRRSDDAMRISETQPGDDIPWSAYRPHEGGGPLHILNVTINETVDGRSQIEQRDRKGTGLAIGPAGLSAGISHHAKWVDADRTMLEPVSPAPKEFRVFATEPSPTLAAGAEPVPSKPIRPETCSIGTWVAISGAAVSTGLGSRTSRGLSILCALLNARLGRWWNSGVAPRWRNKTAGRAHAGYRLGRIFTSAFPVQAYFFTELLARFRGPAQRHWYLTDGGHFENTGAYELVRRRVPMIVLLDHGEDRAYEFNDLANLVRKVRTDFGAEIRFLPKETWALIDSNSRGAFGTLEAIRGERNGSSDKSTGLPLNGAQATLARIHYPDSDSDSLLLVLKPAIVGHEPLDVLEYGFAHESFPQESTADQYFDEAQWESYRRLGQYVADQVFREPSVPANGWSPRSFNPEPLLAALDLGMSTLRKEMLSTG